MNDPKKRILDLDAVQAERVLGISGKALRDLQAISSATAQARSLLADTSIAAQAERFLRESSIGTSSAVREFQQIEAMKKLLDPYKDVRKLLQQDTGIQAMIDAAKQQESLATRFTADIEAAQAFSKNLDHYRDIAKQLEPSFRLPQFTEATRLLSDMQLSHGSAAAYAREHLGGTVALRELLAAMSSPWLREMEAARSAIALVELHGIGSAVRSKQGFDDAVTTALRMDLGDWRDPISFPSVVFDDPVARTELYIARGFDNALTDFPEKSFQESLVLVGLGIEEEYVAEWPEEMHAADAVEEAAFRRTNKCHNYLQRLERRLRQFIDNAMTTQYGSDWPKKRLPPQMLESWDNKKSKAQNAGVVITLFIEVADFTDYEAIICRNDHWKEVFEHRFRRKESVRESLQRLYPIRLATMHARFVTKDDELYVLAESTRLLSAIDR